MKLEGDRRAREGLTAHSGRQGRHLRAALLAGISAIAFAALGVSTARADCSGASQTISGSSGPVTGTGGDITVNPGASVSGEWPTDAVFAQNCGISTLRNTGAIFGGDPGYSGIPRPSENRLTESAGSIPVAW